MTTLLLIFALFHTTISSSCHSSCLTCNGFSATLCQECPSLLFHDTTNNSCYSTNTNIVIIDNVDKDWTNASTSMVKSICHSGVCYTSSSALGWTNNQYQINQGIDSNGLPKSAQAIWLEKSQNDTQMLVDHLYQFEMEAN